MLFRSLQTWVLVLALSLSSVSVMLSLITFYQAQKIDSPSPSSYLDPALIVHQRALPGDHSPYRVINESPHLGVYDLSSLEGFITIEQAPFYSYEGEVSPLYRPIVRSFSL